MMANQFIIEYNKGRQSEMTTFQSDETWEAMNEFWHILQQNTKMFKFILFSCRDADLLCLFPAAVLDTKVIHCV